MQVGTGKSVLNGIAIGKLKIYKKKDTAISTAPVADTAAELERFEAARQKAIEQQTALYEKALAEAGEDIAEVFNIHAMMLDDDDFVDAIKEAFCQKKPPQFSREGSAFKPRLRRSRSGTSGLPLRLLLHHRPRP